MYPETSEDVHKLVDEIANKLKHISGLNALKIYTAPYQAKENLNDAAKKVMQDTRNSKLIVAFTNSKEFIDECKKKQDVLGFISPYKVLGIYLKNDDITENIKGLYQSFFIAHQGDINKKAILEKIYNIMQIRPPEENQTKIDFTQVEEGVETNIKIENVHDNDTTNEIIIKLKNKTQDETEPEDNTNNQNNNQNITSQEPQTGTNSIEITVPSQNPTDPEKTITVDIKKEVTAVKLILSDGSVLINESPVNLSIPNELKIISLDEELMHGATIQIEYGLTVENTSNEFDFKNVVIYDCLNYKYNNNIVYNPHTQLLTEPDKTNESQSWESDNKEDKVLIKTTIDEIQKGGSKTKKLVISKVISAEKDEMYYENYMMLEKLEYGILGDDDTFENYKINTITEENINDVVKSPKIIIIPPTGEKYIKESMYKTYQNKGGAE